MLLNRIARWLPEGNIKHRLEDIENIENLPIEKAGISSAGLPFIRLDDGIVFYGFLPNRIQRVIYRFFTSRSFRRQVPEDAYNVAWDIWLRYFKGHMDQLRHYELKAGDIVVEAGAYVGYYTLKMSKTVGPTGRVIAVEPVKENRNIILKNIEANDIENVTVLPYAVWNEKGETVFYQTDRQKNSLLPDLLRGKGKVSEFVIPTATIDGIVEETGISKPNFVIITVNGVEVEALDGMVNTLDKGVHIVVAAKYVVEGAPTYKRVIAILEEKGYRVISDHYGFTKNENPNQQAVIYASRAEA